MKKKFIKPEIEIIFLEKADVLTDGIETSTPVSDHTSEGGAKGGFGSNADSGYGI